MRVSAQIRPSKKRAKKGKCNGWGRRVGGLLDFCVAQSHCVLVVEDEPGGSKVMLAMV